MSNAQVLPVTVPDIGTQSPVDVIEVAIAVGDSIEKDQTMITLEGEKASMDVPAPQAGVVKALHVKVGDKITQGGAILDLEATEGAGEAAPEPAEKTEQTPESQAPSPPPETQAAPVPDASGQHVLAGPAVRRLAREFGIDLAQISGTGRKNRILSKDVVAFVKRAPQTGGGLQLPPAPDIDFSQFGEITAVPLNKIKRLTGVNVHQSWVRVPHVTNFDEADITELEAFRKANKKQAQMRGVKLTPLVFVMKALVYALKEYPQFNSSLAPSGDTLIQKHYYNLGIAVDTPNGLLVPVIRDVDRKGCWALAEALAAISEKARTKGLLPKEMSGACMTISSLGGIGGTGFTPIVNTPDVAILGVSKAKMQPVYQNDGFIPRLILPFSLSYDHRVIDGAEAARFTQFLAACLSDLRRLIL